MATQIKYPLTDAAMRAATQIVEDWDAGRIDQVFRLLESRSASGWHVEVFQADSSLRWQPPSRSILRELASYHLISMDLVRVDSNSDTWEVLLLQELRNAVKNGFDVSDYFLTTMAVGTIIHGDLTVHPSSSFQSAASITGDITQSIGQLADQLTETLGEPLLESNAEIKAAIDELRQADESNRTSRIGGVVEVLGRYMAHVGSAASMIAGIQMLAQYLPQVVK